VYFNPPPANHCAVGICTGPPNALDAPNPTSSNNTTRTFGAPAGGRNDSIGGYDAPGSVAANIVTLGTGRSGIRNTSRGITIGQQILPSHDGRHRASSPAAGGPRITPLQGENICTITHADTANSTLAPGNPSSPIERCDENSGRGSRRRRSDTT
jgi:hypothetical protein